jgi:hypothetical protein
VSVCALFFLLSWCCCFSQQVGLSLMIVFWVVCNGLSYFWIIESTKCNEQQCLDWMEWVKCMNCILKDRNMTDSSSTKRLQSLQNETHSTNSISSPTIQSTNITNGSANYLTDKPNRIPFYKPYYKTCVLPKLTN